MTDPRSAAIWDALLAMQRHPWEQGVASHAALDEGRADLARLLALDAMVRQDAQGRLGATGDTGLVNCGACGEAVAVLAREGEPGAEEALDRQARWLLEDCPRGESGVLFHIEGRPEAWVDTVYMVVPFLTAIGEADEADRQFDLHRTRLQDPGTRLWAHIYDDDEARLVRGVPWASGNGWVAAGLARALRIGAGWLDDGIRRSWESAAAELIAACAAYELPDGRFRNILGDESSFEDGTAGLMLAFATLTGVADGWLDAAWADAGNRWLEASLAPMGEDGLVRGVCGSPHFDRQGTSAEAQAMALLALAARSRLD